MGSSVLSGWLYYFAWRRGKEDAKNRAWEDFLLIIAPLLVLGSFIFLFNLARSPLLVYRSTVRTLQCQIQQLKQKNESLTTELGQERDRNSPKFELSWASPVVGDATFLTANGSKTSFSDFYVQIAVLNHGAPSVIKDWKGLAKLSDGTVIEGQLLTGNKKNIHIHVGKQELPVEPQLVPIWSNTPVPTGGRGVGSVIVKLPAGLKEKMEMQGAAIIVKLWDMSGKEYQIEIPWSKVAGPGLPAGLSSSLPGMEIP